MAEVTLPQLGETVTEGTITQWFKKVGDSVAADEALFEVSTDKVDTEVPSPVAGTLTEIRVQEGETVEVGTVIAVVGDGDGAATPSAPAQEAPAQEAPAEEAPAQEAPAEESPADAEAAAEAPAEPEAEPAAAAAEPEPAQEAGAAEAPSRSADGGSAKLLSPVVRRLVNEHGLDPAQITGTGPGGRITRDDVLDHIDAKGAKPAGEAAPAAGRRRSRRRRPLRLPRLRLLPPQRRRRQHRRSAPASATAASGSRRSAS